MSRIGKKPIALPDSVTVSSDASGEVKVVGPKGALTWCLPFGISLAVDGSVVNLCRSSESRDLVAKHGLARALVANMVKGVSVGFVKELEIQGVGFKAAVKDGSLDLSLGFSHPVAFRIPNGVSVTVAENTKVRVSGVDRQLVGQVAADIRAYYPPEPYKGKGVRYAGEKVVRKEGKTVQ